MKTFYFLSIIALSGLPQSLCLQGSFVSLGSFGNKQWFANDQKVNQTVARAACASEGLRLGKIDSFEELAWLANLMPSTVSMFPHTDAVFQHEAQSYIWRTGNKGLNPLLRVSSETDPLNYDYGLYVMFTQPRLLSERSSYSQSFICFNQTSSNGEKGTFAVNNIASKTMPKIQARERKQAVGQNVTYLGSYERTQYFIDPSKTPTHYAAASNFCEGVGMSLPSFESNEEMEWLLQTTDNALDRIWTDGTAKDIVTSYRWGTDNTRLDLSLGNIYSYLNVRLVLSRAEPPVLVPVPNTNAYTVCSFKSCVN